MTRVSKNTRTFDFCAARISQTDSFGWGSENHATANVHVRRFLQVPEGSVHGERANFGGLVLGCIDSYDSESRRIFHDFSRSTRFSPLRTALNPKFQQKLAKNFPYFLQKFRKILLNFIQILLNFNEISPEFRQNARR